MNSQAVREISNALLSLPAVVGESFRSLNTTTLHESLILSESSFPSTTKAVFPNVAKLYGDATGR